MSHFLKRGNSFHVANEAAMDIHKKLPAGNYVVKMTPQEELYLEQIEDFKRPSKVYGKCLRNTDRILNTFKSRSSGTGVMLTGEKGSGKTLLAKNLAITAAEQGIPTIVINQPWRGDGFNSLIQNIDQPAIVLFDEFEKVYDKDEQEEMLTLLDGVFPTQKLFVLTCNDKWRVDQHMRNRPGRIFYMIDFAGLETDFIEEYCNDNLDEKKYIETICKIAQMFDQFNFDMLKALVEDMNRYKESPQEVLEMLNAKPEFDSGAEFDVRVEVNGKVIEDADSDWHGNPLGPKGVHIDWDENPEDEDAGWVGFRFTQEHLSDIDIKNGRFVFSGPKATVTLTKKKAEKYNYYAF